MNTETIEGNKIIAEFMGGKLKYYSITNLPYYKGLEHGVQVTFSDLLYHSSWSWLMPVVEKINSINDNEYDVIIWRRDCHINDRREIIFETNRRKDEQLISVVYRCVILFINWYKTKKTIKEKLCIQTGQK